MKKWGRRKRTYAYIDGGAQGWSRLYFAANFEECHVSIAVGVEGRIDDIVCVGIEAELRPLLADVLCLVWPGVRWSWRAAAARNVLGDLWRYLSRDHVAKR